MSTYKEIKGFKVQTLATDTAASVGATGAWASGGNMNTAREVQSGAGTQTSAIAAGGNSPANAAFAITEEYNGSAWSEVADLNNGRNTAGGFGANAEATITYGGRDPGATRAYTESWNGSAWTEVNDMNQARFAFAGPGVGTSTSGIAVCGSPGDTLVETWDGTNWTEVAEVNTRRTQGGAAGAANTAAIAFGGYDDGASDYTANAEVWNGSAWTEVNNLNTKRSSNTGSGTSTEALCIGGRNPSGLALTEFWNGTAWTEVADLAQARYDGASANSSPNTTSIMFGGKNPPSTYFALTEEFSFPPPTATIVQEGDMWFNSTSSTLKGYAVSLPTGTWASGGDLNTARSRFGGAGQATQSAALVFGAGAPPYGQTEEYNGTAWSEQNDMNTGRYISPGGAGTQTAALTAGGYNPAGSPVYNTVNSESYNGTSWTEGNNLNEGRIDCVTFGSSTAAILVGGGEASGGPGTVSSVEIYDGTSWTETTNIPTATQEMAGWGIQTSGAIVGGSVDSDPTMKNTTVEWDGTSWSSGGNYSRNNKYFQAFGSSVTAGLAAGGENPGESPARLSIAAVYNGTSWSEVAELSSARYGTAGGGTTASGLISGGETAPTTVASTEEWTAPAAVVTVTTS